MHIYKCVCVFVEKHCRTLNSRMLQLQCTVFIHTQIFLLLMINSIRNIWCFMTEFDVIFNKMFYAVALLNTNTTNMTNSHSFQSIPIIIVQILLNTHLSFSTHIQFSFFSFSSPSSYFRLMFGCQTVNVSPSPWQTQRGPGDTQINPRWEC